MMQDLIERLLQPVMAADFGGDGDAPESEPGGEPESEAPEAEEAESSEEDEETLSAEEFEELEYYGKKHRVPKQYVEPLRGGLMMEADYRKKTERLAQEQHAFQEAREREAQADKEILLKRGQVAHAENAIAQYEQLDWAKFRAEHGQDAVNQAQFELTELRAWHQRLTADVSENERKSQEAQRETHAKRVMEAGEVLRRDIPNWQSDGPKVAEFAVKELGFQPQQLMQLTDPAVGKALWRAWRGAQFEAAQKKAVAKKPQAEEVEPLRPTSRPARGNSATASSRATERDDMDTWARKERKRLGYA